MIAYKNIKSWHDYLCTPRTPKMIRASDLSDETTQSPWLSLDQFIGAIRYVAGESLAVDLASIFIYSRLFPSWMSGKGDTISEFLDYTKVRIPAEAILQQFLRHQKGHDKLVVLTGLDSNSLLESSVFSKAKPGDCFFALVPSAMSRGLNDLILAVTNEFVDVMGMTAPFSCNQDLIVSLRQSASMIGPAIIRDGNVIEQIPALLRCRLVSLRRR